MAARVWPSTRKEREQFKIESEMLRAQQRKLNEGKRKHRFNPNKVERVPKPKLTWAQTKQRKVEKDPSVTNRLPFDLAIPLHQKVVVAIDKMGVLDRKLFWWFRSGFNQRQVAVKMGWSSKQAWLAQLSMLANLSKFVKDKEVFRERWFFPRPPDWKTLDEKGEPLSTRRLVSKAAEGSGKEPR